MQNIREIAWSGKIFFTVLLVVMWSMILLFSEREELITAILEVRPTVWRNLVVFFLIGQALRACKWKFFLHCLHISIPLKDSLRIYLAGNALALTPGRMGEMIQAYLLEKRFGVAFSKGAPIILAGRITGFLGALSICFVTAMFTLSLTKVNILPAGFLLLIIVIIIIAVFRCKKIGKCIARGVSKLPMCRFAYRQIYRIYLSLYALLSCSKLIFAFFISVGYWIVECMIFYTIVSSISISTTMCTAFLILTSASIGGALSMVPGSIGTLEGGIISLLMYLGSADFTLASVAALIHRFFSLWLPMGIGAFNFCWSLRGIKRRWIIKN